MDIEEASFMLALDKAPNDHTARLVFADWLDERADARAEGFRAIARCGLVLCDRYTKAEGIEYLPTRGSRVFCAEGDGKPQDDYTLPGDWYKATVEVAEALTPSRKEESGGCILFANRQEAENAVALAFASLPQDRRAELLS